MSRLRAAALLLNRLHTIPTMKQRSGTSTLPTKWSARRPVLQTLLYFKPSLGESSALNGQVYRGKSLRGAHSLPFRSLLGAIMAAVHRVEEEVRSFKDRSLLRRRQSRENNLLVHGQTYATESGISDECLRRRRRDQRSKRRPWSLPCWTGFSYRPLSRASI